MTFAFSGDAGELVLVLSSFFVIFGTVIALGVFALYLKMVGMLYGRISPKERKTIDDELSKISFFGDPNVDKPIHCAYRVAKKLKRYSPLFFFATVGGVYEHLANERQLHWYGSGGI